MDDLLVGATTALPLPLPLRPLFFSFLPCVRARDGAMREPQGQEDAEEEEAGESGAAPRQGCFLVAVMVTMARRASQPRLRF